MNVLNIGTRGHPTLHTLVIEAGRPLITMADKTDTEICHRNALHVNLGHSMK